MFGPPSKKARLALSTPVQQQFLARYTKTWPFIVKSKIGLSQAYCTLCSKDFQIGKSGEYDIKRHNAGLKHKDRESSARLPSVSAMLQSSAEKHETALEGKTQLAEFKLVNLIADLNLPVAAADKFSKSFKEMFPDSEIAKKFSCGRTKATALAKDMASIHKDKLYKRMREGPFTLSTDGSNDERQKLFPVVVRTINPNTFTIESELLSLSVCESNATGQNIFELMDTLMVQNKIPWEHCISFGCDNANVMTGIHKGVYAFIKEKHPNLFLAGCTLHLVHLAAEKASDLLPFSPGDLLTDIYYYFNKSSVRQSNFSQFQALHGKDQKKLLKHVSTRWLSIGRCLERLLDNWSPLRSFFQSEKDNIKKTTSHYASSKVKSISEKLGSNSARLYSLFLKYTTSLFEHFLTTNQSSAPQISKLHDSMLVLLKDICKQFLKPSAFVCNKNALDIDFTSSYNIRKHSDILIGQAATEYLNSKSFSSEKVDEFYKNVIVYYKKVVSYLKDNLPFKDQTLVDLCITDPRKVSSDSAMAKLRRFMQRYPVLLQGYTEDQIINSFVDLQISSDLSPSPNDRDDHVWAALCKNNASMKPACVFLLGLLTIPHGSAHCERVFSCVRKNRTDFRPNLGAETLEALMVLKHMDGGPLNQTFTPNQLQMLKGSTSKAVKPGVNPVV